MNRWAPPNEKHKRRGGARGKHKSKANLQFDIDELLDSIAAAQLLPQYMCAGFNLKDSSGKFATPPHRPGNPPIIHQGWKSQRNSEGKRKHHNNGHTTLQRASNIAKGDKKKRKATEVFRVAWEPSAGARQVELHPTILVPAHPKDLRTLPFSRAGGKETIRTMQAKIRRVHLPDQSHTPPE